jgi:hypothetical protein
MFPKFRIKPGYRIVLILLTILLSLYLQTIPLTNSLDFEFSAITGIWFFITGGILFLKATDKYGITGFVKKQYPFALSILLIPFIISFINSVFLNVCPFGNGILFFLFISVVSLLLGIITGASSYETASRHPYILFFLFFFAFIIVSLLEVFLYPQVFTYNPLIGLFPGPIYDELIDFDSKLLLYRIYNLIYFTGFYLLLRIMKRKYSDFRRRINDRKIFQAVFSLSVLIIFFAVYWIGNLSLGFTIPLSKIEKELGGKLTTEHFILIYPKEISKEKAAISALHHEFYYNEISKATNLYPAEKITSILFSSSEQKKKYIGSANADISKPWLNSVVTGFDNHDATLKHEIVHAFSSLIGGKILKASYWFNPALMEGFAAAIEDKEDNNGLYSAAYTIKKFNSRITAADLLSGLNFFGQVSSISYVYSGAFIKWLIEKYGVEKFKQLYTDPDYPKYYSKSLAELGKEFDSFILSAPYTYNENRAVLYFAGKPIFLKKCPRYVAYRIKKGRDFLAAKEYQKSLEVFTEVYKNAESASALSAVVASLIKLNRETEACNLLVSEISKFEKTNSIFSLRNQLADLYVRIGEFGKAKELYSGIVKDNPHQDYLFSSLIKLQLMEKGNNILKEYVKAARQDDRRRIILESPGIGLLFKIYWLIEDGERENLTLEYIGKMESIFIGNDLDLYLLYKTSCFLKDTGRFGEAEKISSIIMNYIPSDKGIIPLLEENHRKINYFIKFADEIKKKFVYN